MEMHQVQLILYEFWKRGIQSSSGLASGFRNAKLTPSKDLLPGKFICIYETARANFPFIFNFEVVGIIELSLKMHRKVSCRNFGPSPTKNLKGLISSPM
jgi:hypothetical protein